MIINYYNDKINFVRIFKNSLRDEDLMCKVMPKELIQIQFEGDEIFMKEWDYKTILFWKP